jgi:hypothetical protein
MRIIKLSFVLLVSVAACGSGDRPSDGGGGGGGDGGGGGGGGGNSGIFPDSNAWNTPIDTASIDPKSAAYIASIGANVGLHQDWSSIAGGNYGIPYIEVSGGQAPVPITFTDYPDESDPGPYPIPLDAPVEDGGDGHVIAVDRTNGFLYELYQGTQSGAGWSAANGAKWNLKTGALRPAGWTSADAAGLPIFPGLVRYDEVSAGEIKHALRFTIARTQKGYIAPATHAAGSCALNSDCPPMGLRVRLKMSVDISGYPASVQVILRALKKYGMIVADNASATANWFISGAPNAGWNDDDLAKIKGVKGSDFEVVTTGPITPQ